MKNVKDMPEKLTMITDQEVSLYLTRSKGNVILNVVQNMYAIAAVMTANQAERLSEWFGEVAKFLEQDTKLVAKKKEMEEKPTVIKI